MSYIPPNHADKYVEALMTGRIKRLVYGESPALLELLKHSVVRVLSKVVDLADPGTSMDVVFRREYQSIIHLRDWLKASLVNDAPWLRKLDGKGRPKKLMKCRDLDALVREADKDMRKQNAAIARKPLAKGEEVLEFECADGWSIVRLLTPAALDRESAIMQHCIGNLHLRGASVRRISGDVAVAQLDVSEDFDYLGDDVRVSEKIVIHCTDRKRGPRYCVAELTERDARAMLKNQGKLDFRNMDELPNIEDPEGKAKVFGKFDFILGLADRFGVAA